MAVTLKDVSREAGVATATASYILSGKADQMKIAESTQKVVMEVARKLNYRANLVAKNLRKRSTRAVGVVFNDLNSSWANQVMLGINDFLFQEDYQPMIGITFFDSSREQKIINAFLDNQIEALIIQPLQDSAAFYRKLSELRRIPFAFIGESVDNAPAKAFMLDPVAAGRLQVSHLAEQGHRLIAVVTSDNKSIQSSGRLLGAEQRIAELGLDYPEGFRRVTCNMSPEQDAANTLELLKLPTPPTAIAVTNDIIAYHVMSALNEIGRSDIAVMGIGDLPESSHAMIGLSTVVEPREEMGRECASYIISQLGDSLENKDTGPVLFKGALAARRSSLFVNIN